MRKIYHIPLLLSLWLLSWGASAQSLELQGTGGISCADNLFHFTIQARSADATNINIGSFSIYLSYNDGIMSFDALAPLNFDGSDLCNAGAAAWLPPHYSADKPGIVNMTFMLDEGMGASSCPTIDNNWHDIAKVTFNVTGFPADSDIQFILPHTHFNSNIPNDGTADIIKSVFQVSVTNCLGDFDGDTISDELDNCPFTANTDQADLNGNGIGDVCEASCDLIAYTGADTVLTCPDTNIPLGASGIGGTPPYTYAWSNGETTDFITVSQSVDTRYYVTVTDANDCIAVDSVDAVVNPMDLVAFVIRDNDLGSNIDTITEGEVFDYMSLPSNYRIRALTANNGAGIEGVFFDLTGTINDDRRDDWFRYDYFEADGAIHLLPGNYSLSATAYSQDNLAGLSCDQMVVNFSVTSACPVDIGRDTSICAGETITYDASGAGGAAPLSFAWSNGSTDPSITVSPLATTTYTVTVTDGAGCVVLDEATIDVTNTGQISQFVILDLTNGTYYDTIQNGEVYFLDDLPTSWTVEVQTDSFDNSVRMITTGDAMDNEVSNSLPHHIFGDVINVGLTAGDYSVLVTTHDLNDALGNSCDSDSISFSIQSCPIIDMVDEVTFCTAVSALTSDTIMPVVTGNSGPYTYAWSDGSSDPFLVVPAVDSTYYVTVTNGLPECTGTIDSVTVAVSDAEMTALVFWDLDNAMIHDTMEMGGVYNLADLPTNFNLESFVAGNVESVYYVLDGDLYDPHLENGAPYRFNGNNNPVNWPPGEYTMTTQVFTEDSRNGVMCDETTIPFSIVNCGIPPIAGTRLDECEAHSISVPTDGNWVDVKDEDGHLIASFRDPLGADLGTVTVDMKRPSAVKAMPFPSMGNLKMINRHFSIESSKYGHGAAFASPVQVRLYFTQQDLMNLNSSTAGDYGLSNFAASQLYLTHYYGNNLDCDYSNDALTDTNSRLTVKNYQSYACDGHYFEFEVTHFSEFFIHEPASPLPVELISFTARLVDERGRLDWESASEYNAKGYEVLRSTDALSWEKIGFVDAEGKPAEYVFWDERPYFGVNYYRLRVVDLDGTSELTDIRQISLTGNTDATLVGMPMPNPTKGGDVSLSITVDSPKGGDVSISNNLGQVLYNENISLDTGNTILTLPASLLPAGIYWLQVIVDGERHIRKFEVLR